MGDTRSSHMDIATRVILTNNSPMKFTFDVEVPSTMPGNMYLADGRCAGTAWDENINDRGAIYLNPSRVIQCTYREPSLKIDGASVPLSSPVPIGRHTIEISCVSPPSTTCAVTTLFGRFKPASGTNVEAWRGKVYRAKLDVTGVESPKSFDFFFGPFIDRHPPTGRLFKDQAIGSSPEDVKAISKPALWIQEGETFTKTSTGWNRMHICNTQNYPPALLRIQFRCIEHGEGRLYYRNRYWSDTITELSSGVDYDIYCPLSKDARPFFDSSIAGMKISNIRVTKVHGCLLHVPRGATSHWVRTET